MNVPSEFIVTEPPPVEAAVAEPPPGTTVDSIIVTLKDGPSGSVSPSSTPVVELTWTDGGLAWVEATSNSTLTG